MKLAAYAAIARTDVKLADLGTVTVSGRMHTAGFGTLEQQIEERTFDNSVEGNASANLNLGRFLPKTSGVQIPVYAGYSTLVSTPQYDPYDTDVKMKQLLNSVSLFHGDDSARIAKNQRQTVETIKSVNVTNMRKDRTRSDGKTEDLRHRKLYGHLRLHRNRLP